MTRTKTILILAFLLVFAAGAVVGTVQRFAGPPAPPHRDGGGSWLTRELKLTPEQQQKMRAIWDQEMGSLGREHAEKRREYQKQRDDAVLALLSDEQKTRYEGIQKEYSDHMAELAQQRQAAFQQAVEKTKQILTPEQVTKYETLLKNRPEHGGPGGGPGGPGGPWERRHREASSEPTTRHGD